jgi:hypothetical protein
MNYICFSSSFFFLITALLALYSNYYVYGILFLFLTITSIIFHTWTTSYTLILDKISILGVILYGAYLFYKKCMSESLNNRIIILQILVLITFLITIYLYCYGYCTNQYCFDKNSMKANLYHTLLHFVSFYGHNIIIIM